MLFYNIFVALTEWPVTYGGEIVHSLAVCRTAKRL